MVRRAEIAPEVAALLPADARGRLQEVLAGQLRCAACGRQLAATEPAAVSVDQFTGGSPDTPQRIVFFTHPTCAPSQVRRRPGPLDDLAKQARRRDPSGGKTTYVLAILGGRQVRVAHVCSYREAEDTGDVRWRHEYA